MMKKLIIATLTVMAFSSTSFAEETMGEKAQVKAKDVKRSIKKGAHKTSETVCIKSDTKCMADKIENRTKEAGEVIQDKAVEVKNKID